MRQRILIILMILVAHSSVLHGCSALVGGAAGAAVYGAAKEAEEDG